MPEIPSDKPDDAYCGTRGGLEPEGAVPGEAAVPEVAVKEKRRVLWYASDGLNGKIGCLGKPRGLDSFQEGLNTGLQLSCVLAGVVGRYVHKGNTGLFGGLLHGEGLHLVERAEL